MGELLRFPKDNEHLRQAAETISWAAVELVTSKYGDGYVDSDLIPSERSLAYHNMQHTMHVRDASQHMAEALELSDYDAAIVRMAASAHDVIQEGSRGEMERASAQWLADHMRTAGFPDADIVAAQLAVLGTEPLMSEDGHMAAQVVSMQQYPSDRAEAIALCVACGDMASLYEPYGPLLGRDIYREMQGVSGAEEPNMDGLLAFQKIQLALLRQYQFPHKAGEELFARLRPDVIAYQATVAEQLAADYLGDWSQLLDQDTEFCQLYLP